MQECSVANNDDSHAAPAAGTAAGGREELACAVVECVTNSGYGRPEKCCYMRPKHMGGCGRGDGESHTCSGTPQMRPRHAKPYRCTSYFFLLMHRSPWRTRSCGADRAPAPGLRLRARVGHSARPRQPPSASSRCSRPCLARPAIQRSPTSSRVPSCCATTSAMSAEPLLLCVKHRKHASCARARATQN